MKRYNGISFRGFWIFTVCSLLIVSTHSPAKALDTPPLTGRVNDYAGMLSAQTRERVESLSAELEASDSTQVVVLTIDSLKGEALEAYSLQVFQSWKIGQKDRDNGVLLLISRSDRKIRIEVGYGLEGRLTDLKSGRIIRNIISPRFKEGNFDAGVYDGVVAIAQTVRGEFKDMEKSGERNSLDHWPALLMPLFFGLAMVGNIGARNRIVGTVAGGLIFPGIAVAFIEKSLWVPLLMIPVGALLGYLASVVFYALNTGRRSHVRRYDRRYRSSRGPIIISGGDRDSFGGDFGGGGGFSGGGGSGGGGGASGGW